MKLKFTEDTLFLVVIVFLLGCGLLIILPKLEKTQNYVQLGTPALAAAEKSVQTEFNSTAMLVLPVKWSAPWAGSCYLTVDVRPSGAPKAEPETPEWDKYHLIRARYDGRWWTQKWINVYVVEERQGQAELRYAIADPKSDKLDIYSELKCDDQLLDQVSTSVTYQIS